MKNPQLDFSSGRFLCFGVITDCSLEHRNDDNEDGGGDDIDDDISPGQWSL